MMMSMLEFKHTILVSKDSLQHFIFYDEVTNEKRPEEQTSYILDHLKILSPKLKEINSSEVTEEKYRSRISDMLYKTIYGRYKQTYTNYMNKLQPVFDDIKKEYLESKNNDNKK